MQVEGHGVLEGRPAERVAGRGWMEAGSGLRAEPPELMNSWRGSHIVDGQHGVLATDPDIVQGPPRNFLCGARQHRLELGL